MSVSIDDLSYFAGFLDGEGCFAAYGKYHKPMVAAENTHRPVIAKLHQLFGGSFTQTKPKKENHRVTYRWAVVSRDADRVCRIIAPYLFEKAPQALLIIAIQALKGQTNMAIMEERERLTQLLKTYKGRT